MILCSVLGSWEAAAAVGRSNLHCVTTKSVFMAVPGMVTYVYMCFEMNSFMLIEVKNDKQ